MLRTWERFLEVVHAGSRVIDTTDFYGHNDADLLQLGNGNFTDLNKARSHFASWAAMKRPLLIDTNITKVNEKYPEIINIVKNPSLHAFNQDEVYGRAAKPFNWDPSDKPPQYLAGPMSYGSGNGTLILMLNTKAEKESMSISWAEAGLEGSHYRMVDIWKGSVQSECLKGPFEASVQGNDTAGIFITPCTPAEL